MNIRGFDEESFWNENFDFFVSVMWFGNWFWFDGIEIYCFLLIFLELVFFGNWVIFMIIFVVVFFG